MVNPIIEVLYNNKHIFMGAGFNVILCYKLECYKKIAGLFVNFISSVMLGFFGLTLLLGLADVNIVSEEFITTHTSHIFEFLLAMFGVSSIAYLTGKIDKLLDVIINKRIGKGETHRREVENDYYD